MSIEIMFLLVALLVAWSCCSSHGTGWPKLLFWTLLCTLWVKVSSTVFHIY